MFCPRCHSEYQPHILRCSECDVPLVESLSVTHRASKRKRISGFVILKEFGVFIVIPIMFVALVYVIVAVRDNSLQLEIGAFFFYTCFVFLLVFCDVGSRGGKGTTGFSLGDSAVRQKLPSLVCLHAGFLAVLLAGLAVEMRIRPHTWSWWHMDPESFDYILLFIGGAMLWGQTRLSRRILERAVKDEQSTGNS